MLQSRCDLRRLRLSLILAALAILGFLNGFQPVVRLTDLWLNVVVFVACLVLPLLATVQAWRATTGWYRLASLLIGVPWSVCSLLLAVLVSEDLQSYRFGEQWTPSQTVTYGPSRIAAYQPDCDYPCVLVRQEMDIAPGVLLVRELSSSSPAEAAHIDVLPDGSVRVDGTQLSLRPHVYF